MILFEDIFHEIAVLLLVAATVSALILHKRSKRRQGAETSRVCKKREIVLLFQEENE